MHKADDGTVEAFEIDDLDEDEVGELIGLETEIAEILAAEDVVHLAEAMGDGSVAGVVGWGYCMRQHRSASAARHAGGQLVASGRIPIQAIAASIAAEDAATSEGE